MYIIMNGEDERLHVRMFLDFELTYEDNDFEEHSIVYGEYESELFNEETNILKWIKERNIELNHEDMPSSYELENFSIEYIGPRMQDGIVVEFDILHDGTLNDLVYKGPPYSALLSRLYYIVDQILDIDHAKLFPIEFPIGNIITDEGAYITPILKDIIVEILDRFPVQAVPAPEQSEALGRIVISLKKYLSNKYMLRNIKKSHKNKSHKQKPRNKKSHKKKSRNKKSHKKKSRNKKSRNKKSHKK